MKRAPLFRNLFIGAGAMKAGTTWLYTMLSRHPQIFFTPEKELHYFYSKYVDQSILNDYRRLEKFNRFVGRIKPERARTSNAQYTLRWLASYLSSPVDDYWYRNLFQFDDHNVYGCDFSNLHALLPADAWPKISAVSRRLKVVYTMRRPIDRMWSHIKYSLQATGQTDLLSTWGPKEFEEFCRRPHMWNHAEYGRVLNRMRSGLRPNQLQVIFFEDVRLSPRDTLINIEKFLGISPQIYSDKLLSRRINETSSQSMPAFLPDLFAKDFERIMKEIESENVVVPHSWVSS